MDLPDFDSSDPAPPPYSHQELDAKLDLALQVSATDHQSQYQTQVPHVPNPSQPTQIQAQSLSDRVQQQDEEWEEWNEDAFRAAEQRLKAGIPPPPPPLSCGRRPLPVPQPAASSSTHVEHLPIVQPLNVRKKMSPSDRTPEEKPRPSWYEEAQLGASTSTNSNHQASSVNVPGSSQSTEIEDALQDLGLADLNDPLAPPPPFAPVGPSLDGPAYQASEHPRNHPPVDDTQSRQQTLLRSYSDSPPPSPLHPALASQDGARATPSSARADRRHSQPSSTSPSRPNPLPVQRTISAYAVPPRIVQPTIVHALPASNPYHENLVQASRDTHSSYTPPKVDASVFYNSAVSSMFIRPTNRPQTSHHPSGARPSLPARSTTPQPPAQAPSANQFYSSASLYRHPYASGAAAAPSPTDIRPNQITYPQALPSGPPPGARTGVNPQLQASGFSSWNG